MPAHDRFRLPKANRENFAEFTAGLIVKAQPALRRNTMGASFKLFVANYGNAIS